MFTWAHNSVQDLVAICVSFWLGSCAMSYHKEAKWALEGMWKQHMD